MNISLGNLLKRKNMDAIAFAIERGQNEIADLLKHESWLRSYKDK